MLVNIDSKSAIFPQIRIMNPNPGKSTVLKYVYDKEITKEGIVEFVNQYVSGKLEPFYRTEVDPKNEGEGYIMPLNSQTFEKIVMDKELDVFVLFTGSSCQLCEELWPVLVKAAKVLSRSQNLIFASINMGLNELDEKHNIYYYPTVRYYPRDNKDKPQDYD